MLRKFQGEPLKPDHILAFCQASFRMTLSWAGFLMLAPGTSLSFTIFQSLLNLMSIESVMPSNHFILCCPLLLLPSIFSSIRVFSSESALHIRWQKYWSFSFSISLSNEYSGFISFRIDWLISLLSKGISSLIQHHSSKASVFVHSAVTSIHDQWKNHSFDYTDLCWQSNVSTF